MTRWLAAVIALGVMAAPLTLAAQSLSDDSAARFRVSANPITTTRGKPAIEGYVVNETGLVYRRVVLAIDIRDAEGRSLQTALVILNDHIRGNDRVYYRATVPVAGSSYVVRVQSYEVFMGGAL